MRSSRRSDPQFFLIEVEGPGLDGPTYKMFYCRISRLAAIIELREYRLPIRGVKTRLHRLEFIVRTFRPQVLKTCISQLQKHRTGITVTVKPVNYEITLPIY